MDVRTSLNPWVSLQSLPKNPPDTLIDVGRGERTWNRPHLSWPSFYASLSLNSLGCIPSIVIIRHKDPLSTEPNAEAKFMVGYLKLQRRSSV